MVRKALLIGCNYKNQDGCELNGCWEDVENISKFLQARGYDATNISLHTDENEPINARNEASVGAPTIVGLIRGWMSTVTDGDVLFFHFSGHGGQLPDDRGKKGDELDHKDECIYGSDLETVSDDELNELLVKPLKSKNVLTVVGDCCHSGSGFDLPFRFMPMRYSSTSYAIIENASRPAAEIFGLSGCRDEQTSADAFIDGRSQGALTATFISVFQKLSINKPRGFTYGDLVTEIQKALIRGKYEQIPQLSYSKHGAYSKKVVL